MDSYFISEYIICRKLPYKYIYNVCKTINRIPLIVITRPPKFRRLWALIGTVSRENAFFWILSKIPPGHLVQLFSDVEIQDLNVSLGLKILYILYIILHIHNLNKQFKVQIIGTEEILTKYAPLENVPKIWAGPCLPLHLDNIQKDAFLFSGNRPAREGVKTDILRSGWP